MSVCVSFIIRSSRLAAKKEQWKSIRAPSKLISKECLKFSSCLASVQRSKPTGVSEDDMIRMATALCSKVEIDHPNDDIGRHFWFFLVWKLLRSHQNISRGGALFRTGSTRTISSGSASGRREPIFSADSTVEDYEITVSRRRPTGRRKAKELEQKDESRIKNTPGFQIYTSSKRT